MTDFFIKLFEAKVHFGSLSKKPILQASYLYLQNHDFSVQINEDHLPIRF